VKENCHTIEIVWIGQTLNKFQFNLETQPLLIFGFWST